MNPELSTELTVPVGNSLFSPLKSRNFAALWGGQTFSQIGDAVTLVALPLTVYAIDQSTLQMGFVFALWMIPMVVLLPFTGIVVDRFSRVFLMIATDSIRFLLMAVLSVLAFSGHLTMLTLDAFVAFYGACSALFQPAYAAARAQVFTPDIRNAANGLTQIVQQGARLVGPAVGGLAIGIAGPGGAFAIDALTFLISVGSLTWLRLDRVERGELINRGEPGEPGERIDGGEREGGERAQRPGALRSFFHELLGGVRELRRSPWLWITILAFALINIEGTGIQSILLPWLVKVHLHRSATVYGVVSSAAGAGAIVSAVLYGRRKHWHHRGWMAYIGVAVSAVAEFALAFVGSEWLLIAAVAVAGAGMIVFSLTWEVSLQELVAPEAYGRVSSLDMFGSFALLPVGGVVTGWVATKIGGIATIEVETLAALAIAVGVLAIPAIRRFD